MRVWNSESWRASEGEWVSWKREGFWMPLRAFVTAVRSNFGNFKRSASSMDSKWLVSGLGISMWKSGVVGE